MYFENIFDSIAHNTILLFFPNCIANDDEKSLNDKWCHPDERPRFCSDITPPLPRPTRRALRRIYLSPRVTDRAYSEELPRGSTTPRNARLPTTTLPYLPHATIFIPLAASYLLTSRNHTRTKQEGVHRGAQREELGATERYSRRKPVKTTIFSLLIHKFDDFKS
jgi:hypothetical protein